VRIDGYSVIILSGHSLAAAALTSWFGLLWGLRLSSCSAIAVKQDAVRAQIGDQRVQIIR
jgi:hypothetical protein